MIGASLSADLAQALSQTAGALRIPVLALALAALVVCAAEIGRFATEVMRRFRLRGVALSENWEIAVRAGYNQSTVSTLVPSATVAAALAAFAEAKQQPIFFEDALADFELATQRRLDRTRILVRVGPALGLMGTLIPLAPGLSALAKGNVAALAGELQTAFAVTVVGLLIGMIAFVLTLTRSRLYSEDLASLERTARALTSEAISTELCPEPEDTCAA